LVQAVDGNFYGVTSGGGSSNKGTFFKMTAAGTVTILHSFAGGTTDGEAPLASLVQGGDGDSYGTTSIGGTSANGVVFRASSAGAVTILHSFGGASDGSYPLGALIQGNDGKYYGTTYYGGSTNDGTAFKISSGGTFTLLHTFGTAFHDGVGPQAGFVQASDGTFYGTTSNGGDPTANSGTVFKMTSGGTITILHRFRDGSVTNDGAVPFSALLMAANGYMYGTTAYGGSANSGTLYQVTTTGAITLLHHFDDGSVTNDGIFPLEGSNVIQSTNGKLLGMALQGGASNKGVIFQTDTYTIMHNFLDGSVTNDGFMPWSLMQSTDGNFYGVTLGGGGTGFSDSYGAFFKMTPTGTVTSLHNFNYLEADNPWAPLIQATDGNFYGTSSTGGTYEEGTVFKVTPSGTVTVLHEFGSVSNDGNGPLYGGLVQNTDGNFYGVTSLGGSFNLGTAYKVTPTGTVTILHNFGSTSTDGQEPKGGLIKSTDGNFYGTTSIGGSASKGILFKMTSSGTVTILHNFADGSVTNDGQDPTATLLQDSSGNFWGTTEQGGSASLGTVFKATAAGTVTILHHFADGSVVNDGKNPYAGLVKATGNFYGTTYLGGSANKGTIFKITPAGVFTILHQFGDGTIPSDGTNPGGTMVLGSDGYLYGTTEYGGNNGIDAYRGIIFRIAP